MSWYKTGTVNVINNSKIVTGINTKWTNPLIGVCPGQMLILQTQNTIEIYEIASIQSDTQLTLAKLYSGTSKTGITYEIPTSPKVSIEALALRVSEMLNYYQIQLEAWQTILTGDGDVTLTAPNGRVVTIRSQLSISNELVKLVEQSQGFAQSARESATTATNASTSASNSENTASSHADRARLSATASANSAEQSRNSAALAQQSENNAKQSEQNAAKSASTVDSSNFIKKRGETTQSISGELCVDSITIMSKKIERFLVVSGYNMHGWYEVYSDGFKRVGNKWPADKPIFSPSPNDTVKIPFPISFTSSITSVYVSVESIAQRFEIINYQLIDLSRIGLKAAASINGTVTPLENFACSYTVEGY
jgi:hypothetical protein